MSTPTSPRRSTSTGWLPVTGSGWRPEGGRSSRGSLSTTSAAATRNADGTYSIKDVIPPDEYADGVNDSVYTNMSAAQALRFARAAARLLHRHADPRWTRVAHGLLILFDAKTGTHPEYAGYPGDAVKQADVTLLSYPWEHPQPRRVTRSRPCLLRAAHGPRRSVDDRRDPLDRLLEAGIAGCPAFTFTRRSVDPFVRPPYQQFAEARSGGAFTFTTGAGGFLQEFLYGYTGFRGGPTASGSTRACPRSSRGSPTPPCTGADGPSASPSARAPPASRSSPAGRCACRRQRARTY